MSTQRTGEIRQASLVIWCRHLKQQIAIIQERSATERPERLYCLEIALGYLFLYLSFESTLDYFMENLLRYLHYSDVRYRPGPAYKEYKKSQRRYAWEKLKFIFEKFHLATYGEPYDGLQEKIKSITKIRNRVVHLEEISWEIITSEDFTPIEELPKNDFTASLTVGNFKKHHQSIGMFFADLRVVLDGALDHREIDIIDNGETKRRNLVDYIYSQSVSSFSIFGDTIVDGSERN